MEWYWIALMCGVVLPWFIAGRTIRIAFAEGRAIAGLGYWFGMCLTREQTLTGAVWPGGNRPPRDPKDPGKRFCQLLHCLLAQKGIAEWLRKQGIDPAHLARCLSEACRHEREGGDAAGRLKALLGSERAFAILTEALGRLGT